MADALLLRADEQERGKELWFAIRGDLLPEAHRLAERGYLQRRRRDLLWRASDAAVQAQETHAVMTASITNS